MQSNLEAQTVIFSFPGRHQEFCGKMVLGLKAPQLWGNALAAGNAVRTNESKNCQGSRMFWCPMALFQLDFWLLLTPHTCPAVPGDCAEPEEHWQCLLAWLLSWFSAFSVAFQPSKPESTSLSLQVREEACPRTGVFSDTLTPSASGVSPAAKRCKPEQVLHPVTCDCKL